MAVIELNHFNLRAPRPLLDRLRDFYRDTIGLQVGARPPFGNFGYWLYAGDQPVLHLSEARPDETRPPHVASTFDHIAFTCTDFHAMRERLDDLEIAYTVAEVPGLLQRQIFFDDPAGNGVELNFSQGDAQA
jgi:catechol-2,3-dioxygenase